MRKKIIIMSCLLLFIFSGCSNQSEAVLPADISITESEISEVTAVTEQTEVTKATDVTTVSEVTEKNILSDEEECIENLISDMTLKEKIYQLFIVTPECAVADYDYPCTEIAEEKTAFVAECPVGGIICFSQNIESSDQLKSLTSEFQRCSRKNRGIGMFMSVDEEGGEISRIAETFEENQLNTMRYYGEQDDKELAYSVGEILADTLKSYGFNLDFAPVADVNTGENNGLYYRSFSSDPYIAADMVSEVVKGLQDNGVCATLKHFPGLGSSNGDTHEGTVVISQTEEEFENNDFIPFRAGIAAGAEFIMVGHAIAETTGEWLPSDLSETVVTEWLREKLNYNGIIITDAHTGMESIAGNYTPGDAAVKALQAGVDIILMPDSTECVYEAIAEEAENNKIFSEHIDNSLRKILALKYKMNLIEK